jgi:integrase
MGETAMSNRKCRVPSYRCKKSNGRKYGCVSLPDGLGGRRDILLGPFGSQESKAEYARVISEWETAGRKLPQTASSDITINELILAFWDHAEKHYRNPDGEPTTELQGFKISLRPLKELYGHTLAREFGPKALKVIRDRLISQPITKRIKVRDSLTGTATWSDKVLKTGLARGVINQRIGRIRRLFRWAVANELVPISVFEGLRAVPGLQRGRSGARETEPVRPVSISLVEDTLPHLSPVVADMIRLQLLTGARSGEICLMRSCDIEVGGSVWLYRPRRHKTSYKGFDRVIPLGPKSQEIVRRYLRPHLEEFLFSPRDSIAALRQERRSARKSKVQPSQLCRKKTNPRRVPGSRYNAGAIAHAVRRACEKHNLQRWHPHMLRHTKATDVRREYGLDAARALLGQHAPQVTELYAELDLGKAVEVARKLG